MLRLLLCVAVLLVGAQALNDEFVKKIDAGLGHAKNRISEIAKQWEIPNYPLFLKTCSMHKTSLEILKWKYQKKILSAQINGKHEKFVVSFTGSSVTAGHDSLFNETATPEVGRLMTDALAVLDVDFESRNVALGNNPCIPYDVCVKFFAGEDADMVHWEQNYFCSGDPLEYFIRQAMTIPTRPIVVFSTSSTGHWDKDKCASGPHKVTDAEQALLGADVLKLVTELNKDTYHGNWADLTGKDKHYHGAAVQAFSHHGHEAYACLGPYIKNWMDGAASWHPSVIAHKLRASHHAYFWLSIWVMALQELHDMASHRALDAIAKDVEHHLDANYPAMPPPLHKGPFLDNTTCYTDYEPRHIRESSLKNKVIRGLVEGEDAAKEGWKFSIYEDIVDRNLVKRSLKMGYLDFKWMLYSKDNTVPLSLQVDTQRNGPLMICETPGIWGKLPESFTHLWEDSADFYIDLNVADKSAYSFDKTKAQKLDAAKLLDLCVEFSTQKDGKTFPVGHHVLTVVPREKKNVIVAWLLTP